MVKVSSIFKVLYCVHNMGFYVENWDQRDVQMYIHVYITLRHLISNANNLYQ